MIEETLAFQIFTIIVVAIIVYPKALVPIKSIIKTLFDAIGKLLGEAFDLLIKVLTELFKLLGVLVTKFFELLASFAKWLINRF